MKTTFLILCTGIALHVGAQQPIPAAKQKKSILLMNGIAHIGNGQLIENSVVGFKDGKITLIGDARTMRIDISAWDTTINISGKHVYPGFIAPNSTLGLTEIEAVRASNDWYEVGGYNPHVRSQIAYNAESRIIPTVRTNGVLLAQVTPRGGRISGTSSVMQLDGWNWTDATQRKDDGVHINWPSVYSRQWSDNGMVYEKSKNYEAQKQELQQFFAEAKAYLENPSERNLRFEAMRGVFNGTQRLYIHADAVKDITESVAFAQKFGVKHVVIVGGTDSWKCAEFLKNKNISVMLTRVHSLPVRSGDDLDQPFKTAAQLHDAGVLFCFQNEGDQEASHTRNLPFLAGTAVAYGLPKEQAVAALTGNAALILGIADRTGTLEAGKDATLFISEGDALDMSTNKVTWAFIEGRRLDLRNEQQELNEIYLKKYGLDPK
jgi:imidazolonepropionase-like amidohydrolase